MTTTVVTTSHTATLGAGVEDIVKFSQGWGVVKVSVTGTGTVWFRTDGGTAAVAGQNSRPVVAGTSAYVLQFFDGEGADTRNPVSVISSGTPSYTVEGVNLPPLLADLVSQVLALTGGLMEGDVNMGGFDLTNVGNAVEVTSGLSTQTPVGGDLVLGVKAGVLVAYDAADLL